MLLKTFLTFSNRSQCYNKLLNITKTCSERKQMTSLALPLHQSFFRSYKYPFVSSIFSYLVYQLDLKFSHSIARNEGSTLHDLLSEDLEISAEKRNEVKKIITYLLSKGYTSKDIKDKFLMCLKSKNISYAKFNLLEVIDPDIELLLPLLSLPKSTLKLAAHNSRTDRIDVERFPSRIYYLSHHLELKPSELIPALARHSSLLTMNFERLNYKMNILKSANINSKYIVKDLWIFNYKEELIASRIQAALKTGVELKPWMLRCSEKTFQSILTKTSESQRILGNESVKSYLAKRLDCSNDYIDYLMLRNKLLKRINIPKLEQIINFLYEKGYTPQEVRLFPRVFCSSLQSLEKRFKDFQDIKETLPTIAHLCMFKKKVHSKLKEEI